MAEPAYGFHEEFQARLADLGWSAGRAAREAGYSEGAGTAWVRTGRYPQPARLEHLIAALGIANDMAERWRAEVAAAFRDPRPAVRRPPKTPRVVRDQRPCAADHCTNWFSPATDDQTYCSRGCQGTAPRSPRPRRPVLLDNPVKRAFQERRKLHNLTLRNAAREIGIHHASLVDWLKTPDRRLQRSNIERLAAWLEVPVEEVIRLQGGTEEARRREVAAQNSPIAQGTFWTSKVYAKARRKQRDRRQQATTGRTHTDEAKKKISDAKKAYYTDHPGEHPGQAVAGTQWLSAQMTLRNLRRHHPELSADEIERMAVQRITARLRPGSEEVARALLKPRKSAKKPGKLHGGGPKRDRERLAIALELYAGKGLSPEAHAYRGFLYDLDEKLRELGLPSPGPVELKHWWSDQRPVRRRIARRSKGGVNSAPGQQVGLTPS